MVFGGILKFKKLVKEAKITYPVMQSDVGYDMCSIEDKVIKPSTSEIVHTGLAFEIPEDYYALVRTRSGYGVKNSLQLHHGLIDPGYRNEITVCIYNHSATEYRVSKGDKVAQLVILPRIVLPLKEVSELHPSERNLKGLGSTGR